MIDYKAAGVNIDTGNNIIKQVKSNIQKTFSPQVLTELGSFAGLYDLKALAQDYEHPVLVQSIDGLGTKPMVARLANQYNQLGHDLLSATVNDILVLGAKPLTLLDYVASSQLNPKVITTILNSLAEACSANQVSLIGGETAEMPGVYQDQEIDLVGIVTGVVDKSKIINGKQIQPGDLIYGVASSGLHTNGYSLARKLIFESTNHSPQDYLPETDQTLAEVLLAPHINYNALVQTLLAEQVIIHGMAHITGGGLLENLPRVLPGHCSASIHLDRWPQLPVFNYLAQLSQLPRQELYRTFNMGIGYVIIIPETQRAQLESVASQCSQYELYPIGEIRTGKQEVDLNE